MGNRAAAERNGAQEFGNRRLRRRQLAVLLVLVAVGVGSLAVWVLVTGQDVPPGYVLFAAGLVYALVVIAGRMWRGDHLSLEVPRPAAIPLPDADHVDPPDGVAGRPAGSGSPAEWADAVARVDRLDAAYAQFEADPLRVLRLPGLTDVGAPPTARFLDALAAAHALRTDRYPGPGCTRELVAAARTATRAWRAARRDAQRSRNAELGPAERLAVDRVLELLTAAMAEADPAERQRAYGRARAELAELDRIGRVLPSTTRAALAEAVRGSDPAVSHPAVSHPAVSHPAVSHPAVSHPAVLDPGSGVHEPDGPMGGRR